MPKYWVDFAKYTTVEIEADSEEEAIEIASSRITDTEWLYENVTLQED